MKTLFARRKILLLLLTLTLLSACGKACQKGGGLGGLTGGKTDPLDIFPAKNHFLLSINVKKLATLPIYGEMIKDAPAEAKELSTQVDDALISLNLRGPTRSPRAGRWSAAPSMRRRFYPSWRRPPRNREAVRSRRKLSRARPSTPLPRIR